MKVLEDAQLEVKRKLPWFIDVLLYPLSVSGVIHLVIFLFVPLLINKFAFIDYFYFGIIRVVLYALFMGYLFYYLAYCVFDSSKGGYRAPDVSTGDIPNKAELISQLFLLLGSVAICFWPVSAYYLSIKRIELWFWLLFGFGVFFLPMAFLRAALFDSFDALNPILIIDAISKTFLPYCGLVLFFCVPLGLAGVIISNLPTLQSLPQIPFYISIVVGYLSGTAFFYHKIAFIYLAMVAAHLLGRFYWWHKDRLAWGL